MTLGRTPTPSRPLFWAFLLSTVGVFTTSALVVRVLGISSERAFSTRGQWQLVCMEVALGVIWLPLLRQRGWSLKGVTMPFDAADLLRGIGLAVVCCVAYWLGTSAWMVVFPAARLVSAQFRLHGGISWSSISAVSFVNASAEEFVYLGFITNALYGRGKPAAITLAVASRMAVHIYQGPIGVVGIAAIGCVIGVYYDRTRRLWPAIVAHGLLDFLALARMAA